MNNIGIVNYGMGNLASVANAVEFCGFAPVILDDPSEIPACDKLILPGVGAFARAMDNLEKGGWIPALKQFATIEQRPLLGLCLGMQLLFETSQEHGIHNGLGLIPGTVNSIRDEQIGFPVPHMGWNNLVFQKESPLTNGLDPIENDVYFVHSYYCSCADASDKLAVTTYGIAMDVMVQRGNIFGCQFHPEKSQVTGLRILTNFCQL